MSAVSRGRLALVAVGAALLLGGYNASIYQKERLLARGTVVRLALAPRDPRALLTGDYMALNFALAREAAAAAGRDGPADLFAVVSVDERRVARLLRVQQRPTPLAAGELVLRLRVRRDGPRLGTDAFYFREGDARRYEPARFGEFRVDAGGEMLLTQLLGAQLEPL